MSEIPSSAITAAPYARPSSAGRADAVADARVTRPIDAGPAAGMVDDVAASALDDAPLDLLVRPGGLVEIALPADAPLYAVDGVEDWSGAVHDVARLCALRGSAFDLVFDGADGGSHVRADDAPFAGCAGLPLPDTAMADPLVVLDFLDGEPEAFPSAQLDAPLHVDVAVDDAARVGLEAPDLRAPEVSWLAAINGDGLHVGEAWAWDDAAGGYVFDHYV